MESTTAVRGGEAGRSPRPWEWALVLVPFLSLAAVHWNDLPSRQAGDYAQYLLHAKALVEGRPYDATGYIYSPYAALTGPRVQPPGWPLLLAPVVGTFGLGLLVPKILITLAAVGFLTMVMKRMSRSDDPTLLAVAVGGSGLALETSYATNSPLSDLPFCAMLWGIVILTDTSQALTWRRAALIGLLTGYAILTRIAGVALVPAFVLLAIVRPRDRRVLLGLTASMAAIAIGAVAVVGVQKIPFLNLLLRTAAQVLTRMSTFGDRYRLPFFEATMYPMPWDLANDAYHLLALLIVPLGMVAFMRRFGRSLLGCLVLTYAVMILLSPVADARYLWPFWPVMLYWVVAGTRSVATRVPRLAPHGAKLALLLGIVVLLGGFTRAVRTPSPAALLGDREVRDLFAWVRQHPERDSMRMVFVRARVLTMETGVPAMAVFQAPDSVIESELRRARITHVILGDAGIGLDGAAALASTVASHPALFTREYANGSFAVYRFHPGASVP